MNEQVWFCLTAPAQESTEKRITKKVTFANPWIQGQQQVRCEAGPTEMRHRFKLMRLIKGRAWSLDLEGQQSG